MEDVVITRIVKPGLMDEVSLIARGWLPETNKFIVLSKFILYDIMIKTDAPFFEIWFTKGLNESRDFYCGKEFKTQKDKTQKDKTLYEYLCLGQTVIYENTIIGVDMNGFYDFSLTLSDPYGCSVKTSITGTTVTAFNKISEHIIKLDNMKTALLNVRNEIERYERLYQNPKH